MTTSRRRRRVPHGYAERADVEAFAETLPADYVLCRTIRHPWKPAIARRNHDGTFHVELICERCTTKYVQELSPRGLILGTHYVYPQGYQMPKGQGRITGDDRGILRLAFVDLASRASRARG